MKFLLTILLLHATWLHAHDGVLLELTVPPLKEDRFQHAEFSCWVADASKPVKAVIIHQHGCTNASPDRHPPITSDWHWRALARKHQAALLVPMYHVAKNCDEWNDPDSGSERALFTALDDFARRMGRAELKEVPWMLWGHSGGSSWSAQMILRHPQRVLAASFRGGCSKQFSVPEFRAQFIKAARTLPMLFVWGKRESAPPSKHFVSWVPMNTMFHELRSAGGHVTRVIDPRSEHGCDDSRFMSLNFFDAALEGKNPPALLADIETLDFRPVSETHLHEPSHTWLPNAAFAEMWREFSQTGTLRSSTAPSQPATLQVTRVAEGGVKLTWRIIPELAGGLRAIHLRRDGRPWKEFQIKPDAFIATGRDSAPEELREHSLIDESSGTHSYSLIFFDNGSNASPPSENASAP